MVFTAAGIIGLMGVNDAGVGVVVNNLAMLPSSTTGLPVAAVARGVIDHDERASSDRVRRTCTPCDRSALSDWRSGRR